SGVAHPDRLNRPSEMNIVTKSFSSLNLFRNNLDVSNRACVGYFAAFLIIATYALYTNGPCLFFDWDGQVGAVVMDYFQQFSSSFSIAMVDPLQGMFDTYYLGYRGGLPQIILMSALGMPGAHKTLTHLFYDTALTFSVYAMGRTAGFDRKTSLLAA